MLDWLRDWWHKTTTMPCESCGASVLVTAYRKTGRTRKESWWEGDAVELECPNCGHAFWSKK